MMRITVFVFAAAMLATASGAALAQLTGRGSDFDSGIRGDHHTRAEGGARRILNVDPADRYRDGVTALKAGNYRDAQRAFRDVLSREARDPSTNFLMGVSLANDTKLTQARSYLERAVRYKNDFTEARGWLGVAYAKTGEAEKASEQKAALTVLKTKCAGTTCADATAVDAALIRIEDAITNPAAPFPPLPRIAATYGEEPF